MTLAELLDTLSESIEQFLSLVKSVAHVDDIRDARLRTRAIQHEIASRKESLERDLK